MEGLNLYSNIGGNRKDWTDINVTAVEIDKEKAEIYKELHPNDTVIVGDAHQYLLENYMKFDFIWSSPPCPTHSSIRNTGIARGGVKPVYADMVLYQEIILLKNFADAFWVVENVKPYYKPLYPPTVELQRHYFWSNFYIPPFNAKDDRVHNDIKGTSQVYGFDLNKYNIKNKRLMLRDLVNPKLGAHILNSARNSFPPIQDGLFETVS